MVLRNLIRIGIVSDRSADECAVRVVIEDQDELVTDWLPVIVPSAGRTKDFILPDVGDRVVCLFLGNGLEAGFCLGSYYSGDVPSGATGDKRGVWFEDGSYVEFDRNAGILRVKATSSVAVTAPTITIDGNATVTGNLTVNGRIFGGG